MVAAQKKEADKAPEQDSAPEEVLGDNLTHDQVQAVVDKALAKALGEMSDKELAEAEVPETSDNFSVTKTDKGQVEIHRAGYVAPGIVLPEDQIEELAKLLSAFSKTSKKK